MLVLPAAAVALMAQPAPAPGSAPVPAVAPPGSQGAGAAIQVVPTRLVFDARKRAAEVTLNNPGNAPGTFRIFLSRMEMDEDGRISELPLDTIPGQPAAQDMVRFSPRMVTLDPGQSQVVRLQVMRPPDLADGEYRLYLIFRQEAPPPPEPLPADQEAKGISVRLVSLFGMAIPLIIRQGATSVQVRIAAPVLGPDGRSLRVRLERSGNQSVYGNLQATWTAGRDRPRVVGTINGLAVYSPNPHRNVVIPMDPAVPKGGGRLAITYSAPPDQGGALLAEASLEVP